MFTVASVFRSVLKQVPPGDQAADVLSRAYEYYKHYYSQRMSTRAAIVGGRKTCWETPDTLAVAMAMARPLALAEERCCLLPPLPNRVLSREAGLVGRKRACYVQPACVDEWSLAGTVRT